MRGELVAIDLETTGLDVHKDFIIEVGAVRMQDGEITARYETMVNPGIPIPTTTTNITGIQQNDVNDAPAIDKVLPEITSFVGTAPVIAHNATLDMGLLQQRHGILIANTSIDTYDLASIVLPGAPRYNLTSLTQQMGIELENAHRALDDAHATALLYWALWQRICLLPHATLDEISRAAEGLKWDSAAVFIAALRESKTSSREKAAQTNEALFGPTPQFDSPRSDGSSAGTLATQEVEALIAADGALASTLPNYEARAAQIDMATIITGAFNQRQHMMVEADTGTGKSLAYLVPAILWATQNDTRVVISTNTLNLQDQLIEKDIPALQAALDIDFNAAVMKGRANYLCPRRLEAMRRRGPVSVDELRTLAKILVWLLESKSGDRGEINLRGLEERTVWQRLSAADEGCALDHCEAAMGGLCPFYRARRAAEAAHVLVVNHSLLIADADSENSVLPNYRYAIIDEAHHLESAVTSSATYHINQSELLRRMLNLSSASRGLLWEINISLRDHIPAGDHAKLEAFMQDIADAARKMDVHIKKFFMGILAFIDDVLGNRQGDYLSLVRVGTEQRGRSSFAQLQARWKTLSEFLEVVGVSMQRLTKAIKRLKQHAIPRYDDLISSTRTTAHYLETVRTQLQQFALEPDTNTIYWVSIGQGDESPTIHGAPLHIGPLVEKVLWQRKDSVILTSATLRTHNEYAFIRDRLFADSVGTHTLESTFDYEASTLVYIPNDIPEPNNRQGYQHAVEQGIIELAAALDGRVLVLFTSYAQLRQTSQAITPRLALGDITVYDQSDGTSRQALLDGFKSAEKAVLLGTKSFWEGIDIPGDDLSALVIVRLPFAVPTDPIFAARSETYADPFQDYAVPEAVLRFRQGFGRLIRSSTDRGVLAVFDSRIITKSYGMHFLEALPDCTSTGGPLKGLPQAAKDWLEKPS